MAMIMSLLAPFGATAGFAADTASITGTITLPTGMTSPAGNPVKVRVMAWVGDGTYTDVEIPAGSNQASYSITVPITAGFVYYTMVNDAGLNIVQQGYYKEGGDCAAGSSGGTPFMLAANGTTTANMQMAEGKRISGAITVPDGLNFNYTVQSPLHIVGSNFDIVKWLEVRSEMRLIPYSVVVPTGAAVDQIYFEKVYGESAFDTVADKSYYVDENTASGTAPNSLGLTISEDMVKNLAIVLSGSGSGTASPLPYHTIKGTIHRPAGVVGELRMTFFTEISEEHNRLDMKMPDGQDSLNYTYYVFTNGKANFGFRLDQRAAGLLGVGYYNSAASGHLVPDRDSMTLLNGDAGTDTIDFTPVLADTVSGTISIPAGSTAPDDPVMFAYVGNDLTKEIGTEYLGELSTTPEPFDLTMPQGAADFIIKVCTQGTGDLREVSYVKKNDDGTYSLVANVADATTFTNATAAGNPVLTMVKGVYKTVQGTISLPAGYPSVHPEIKVMLGSEKASDSSWTEKYVTIPADTASVNYSFSVPVENITSFGLGIRPFASSTDANDLVTISYYQEGAPGNIGTDYEKATAIPTTNPETPVDLNFTVLSADGIPAAVSLPSGVAAPEYFQVIAQTTAGGVTENQGMLFKGDWDNISYPYSGELRVRKDLADFKLAVRVESAEMETWSYVKKNPDSSITLVADSADATVFANTAAVGSLSVTLPKKGAIAPAKVGAVTDIQYVLADDGKGVDLKYTKPLNQNGIDHYTIEFSKDGGATWQNEYWDNCNVEDIATTLADTTTFNKVKVSSVPASGYTGNETMASISYTFTKGVNAPGFTAKKLADGTYRIILGADPAADAIYVQKVTKKSDPNLNTRYSIHASSIQNRDFTIGNGTNIEDGSTFDLWVVKPYTAAGMTFTEKFGSVTATAASSAKAITATSVGAIQSGNIINVPEGTKVSALKAGLSVSAGASVEILASSGGIAVTDQTITDVTSAMKVNVTAEDGTAAEYSIALAVPAPVAVTGITLDNASLALVAGGSTGTLTATVAPADASNKNVTWTSSNTAVATVANGNVTPVAGGTAVITATSAADSTKKATCTVTVTQPVAGVSLNKATTTLKVGAVETLTVNVAPANATNKNVIWESSNINVATVNSGVVTAVARGTATITATSAADNTKKATCVVTVKSDINTLTGITIGGSALAGFDAATITYSKDLADNATTADVALTKTDANATVSINGEAVTSKTVTVKAGVNPVILEVTSEYGTKKIYTVNLNVPIKKAEPVTIGAGTNKEFVLPGGLANTDTLNFNVDKTITDAKIDLGTPANVAGKPQVEVAAAMNMEIKDGANKLADIEMPKDIKITAPAGSGWNGDLGLPEIKTNTTTEKSVEIGLDSIALTFDKPVKIVIPGMAGKSVKWVRNGVPTEITTVLTKTTGEDVAAELLAAGKEDGKQNSGSDLVIWTKHFTEFVAYTPAPVNNGGSTSGGGGSGGGGGASYQTIQANEVTKLEMSAIGVEIPAGALKTNNSLKTVITELSKNHLKVDQKLISDIWGITLINAADFQKAWSLKMNYSVSKVDLKKEKLELCWLDEKAGAWVPLTDIKVDDKAGKVTGTTLKTGSFALISTPAVAPAVTPIQPPATTPTSAVSLKDIVGHWAEVSIKELVGKKAVSGNPDGTFQPEKQISRAEFLTVLVKALDLKGTGDKQFGDTSGHWADASIQAAIANGIVTGYADGTFKPDASITREEMAVMIMKAKKLTAASSDKSFSDAAGISVWAKSAVETVVKNGLMSGYEEGSFKPAGLATKAEAVTIIARAIK